ncbi:heme O synthase-like polyprenyltransferase [Clostridium tetanomorphum]|nr:heme O synthase-like polyprenyltransferase [Clostridium tetanomorphum]NRS83662.1 heme O synthase-like polyprenyltransferase [Clostridium tetanomorphum]NRZ96854.1 heme O synthase-like polyprenyltransferase [Clostridium tetanomorphum]SQC02071.1 Uncharacterised protein [Clostridium tetanomorphum]
MKILIKNIQCISLGACIIYFISRIIYEISHIKIINQITVIISIFVGITMFIISLISFFYEKKKKEAIEPFIISIILIFADII